VKTRISTKHKPHLYSGFSGITTARSEVAMERPEAQPLAEMSNLYCNAKGYITNEPGFTSVGSEQGHISHLKYHDTNNNVLAYAARDGGGTSLRCINSYGSAVNIWPRASAVCSAYFNRNLVFAAGQETMRQFDGADFKEITSKAVAGARYICQVSNRMVITGFDDNPCEIKLSRVNDATIYDADELPADASVLKAARLNIQNLIGSGDRIRGIASFETNKLAVFTSDRVLVYITDPDYTKWVIDSSSTVRYGTISHKSIVAVGGDLFFCSSSGVHSIRRSVVNGSTVFTTSLSEDITELYQSLLASVPNRDDISASFDPVAGRVHIYFPVNDSLSYRLSAAMADAKTEQDITKVMWSLSTYGGITCGDYQSGRSFVGTISGVKEVAQWYATDGLRGPGFARLPTLWHGDIFNPKHSLHMVLYASGYGEVKITAFDETQRPLSVISFELPQTDQIDFAGVPLQRQFIRPFSHLYTGLRLTVDVKAGSLIRIFAIGVNTKE
jgi:hypothetical protein